MGNCCAVQDAEPLALQIQLNEKEEENTRLKNALMDKEIRLLQDAQEVQEVAKVRELILLDTLRNLRRERSSLTEKNRQLTLLNRQLAKNLNHCGSVSDHFGQLWTTLEDFGTLRKTSDLGYF